MTVATKTRPTANAAMASQRRQRRAGDTAAAPESTAPGGPTPPIVPVLMTVILPQATACTATAECLYASIRAVATSHHRYGCGPPIAAVSGHWHSPNADGSRSARGQYVDPAATGLSKIRRSDAPTASPPRCDVCLLLAPDRHPRGCFCSLGPASFGGRALPSNVCRLVGASVASSQSCPQ